MIKIIIPAELQFTIAPAWRNGTNFSFNENPTDSIHILKNNLSFQGSVNIASSSQEEKNSWNGFTVSSDDFESLDTALANLPRDEQFNLVRIDFLRLSSSSSLINGGIDVGIPFLEIAPDLGAFEYDVISTGLNEDIKLLSDFILEQNYPNPFNPYTRIKYTISTNQRNAKLNVKLSVYNILGKKVSNLVSEQQNPGSYEVEWNGVDYSSGVYIYKLETAGRIQTKKMTLIK